MDEQKMEKLSWSFTPQPDRQRTHLGCGYYADLTTEELTDWFRYYATSPTRERHLIAETHLKLAEVAWLDLDAEAEVRKCMNADRAVFEEAEAWHKALLAKRAEQETSDAE